MKISYERYDFANGVVEKREREIDSGKVLAGNALFQQLSRKLEGERAPEKDPA